MTSAALAMGRAVESLDRLKTTDALPPEMEALNHLLRAQADVKRREVMRQQAGGGGGQNRASEDLSNLFDKELARQQQTNYETPTTTEQRDERRQRSRQHPGARAAAGRSAAPAAGARAAPRSDDARGVEARARTADPRADRTAAARGRNGATARAAEPAGGTPEPARRPAAEPAGCWAEPARCWAEPARCWAEPAGCCRAIARSVAGDGGGGRRLRRQDPAAGQRERRACAAGAAGTAAAAAAGPARRTKARNGRHAAGGETACRRTARDRGRTEQSPGQSRQRRQGADTRRRLAGEQERLADRMRRLQGGLQEQANAPDNEARRARPRPGRESRPGDRAAAEQTRNAAREATREIDRQRLPERMQQSAPRCGARLAVIQKPAGQTRRDQEDVARALDRLADRIGDAFTPGDEASRKIADQLTRAQDLRDEIDKPDARGRTARRKERPWQRPAMPPGCATNTIAGCRKPANCSSQIGRDNPEVRTGGIGFTFEGQGMVMSAPGTEPFKQDFAKWEQLRKQVTLALDRAESELSRRSRLATRATASPRASTTNLPPVPAAGRQLLQVARRPEETGIRNLELGIWNSYPSTHS